MTKFRSFFYIRVKILLRFLFHFVRPRCSILKNTHTRIRYRELNWKFDIHTTRKKKQKTAINFLSWFSHTLTSIFILICYSQSAQAGNVKKTHISFE